MTERVSVILILSLLVVALVAMSAQAVKSPDESPRVINPRVYKSLQYAFPDATNSGTFDANPSTELDDGVSLGKSFNGTTVFPHGVKIGDTWYDYQHNGRMTRMVDWGVCDDGFMIHFLWMNLDTEEQENRCYAYNVYYATGGSAGTFINEKRIQTEGEYAGYVSLDVTDDNRAVLSGHNNWGSGYQAHTYWDFQCGWAFFGANRRVEDSVIAAGTGQDPEDSVKSAIWPSIRYQETPGKADPVLHVFTQVSEEGAGDPQAIIYFRKVGLNETGEWDYPPYVVDTVFDIAQDVACSNYDGKVALTWIANLADPGDCDTCSTQTGWPFQQWDNDVYYQISNDYGAPGTFLPRVNLTQNQDGVEGYRPYTDMQALITWDNDLHIVWGARYWPADANAGGQAGLLRCRIFHWGENLGWDNIRTVASLDWDQTTCNGGAWQLNGSKMNISECDGKLYCLWTQFNDIPDGIEDDCAARAFEGSPDGAANGELYLAVSDDLGLTWDGARNLTNTHTPHCDSATGVGGACLSEHWSSMNRHGTNLTGDWSGAQIIDPSGGEYQGDYYLDVQYIGDPDPGGIVQNEGTWQNADVMWFRLPCVDPVPTPGFNPSWTKIAFPEWTKHGTAYVKPLTIENPGNIATVFEMFLNEDPGPYSGWLSAEGSITGGTINSGENNTVSGNVTINAWGAINIPGTIVHLSGNMHATGNFGEFVFPIDFWIVDSIISPKFDTITTGCFSLVVSNMGNWGNQGTGEVNLDFFNYGDCDNAEPGTEGDTLPGDATIYAYDASPVICWTDADSVICNWSIYGQGYLSDNGFIPMGHVANGAYYTHDTCDGANDSTYICDTYYSQFTTRDTGILIEKWWYMPAVPYHQDNDGSNFIVQILRISVADGQTHTGLNIGEAIDWDIPSDSASRNRSGFDVGNRLIYQQGSEYNDDDEECQDNSDRYGGIELLATKEVEGETVTESTDFYGCYTEDNSAWVYPAGGFVPTELDSLMTVNEGYVIECDSLDTDLHSVMTFKSDYTLTPTKTLWIYKCLITSRLGWAAFLATAQECHDFYDTYLKNQYASCEGEYPCGDFSCDDWIDIVDFVMAYNFLLTGGPPSMCPNSADCDNHSMYSLCDFAILNRFMFHGGSPPVCPPTQPPIGGPVNDLIFLHTFESSYPSADYFPAGDSSYAVHVHFTTDRAIDVASLPFHLRVSTEIPIIDSVVPNSGSIATREFFALVDKPNAIIGAASIAYTSDFYFEPGTYEVCTIYLTMAAQDSAWRPILVGWDSLPPIQNGRHTHYPYVTEPSGQAWTPSIYRRPCIQPIRGDMDYNGGIDIADLVHLVDFMFSGGWPPVCFEEADVADDGLLQLDISDLVYLVDYMFNGGPPPPPCPPE